MAWNHDGSLLASASQKGTVLRVHRLPQASKAFTFRCVPQLPMMAWQARQHQLARSRGQQAARRGAAVSACAGRGVTPDVCACYGRRGTYPAPIHSLAFSPASVQPPLLCAASGHGTVHLFRLEANPDRCAAAFLASGGYPGPAPAPASQESGSQAVLGIGQHPLCTGGKDSSFHERCRKLPGAGGQAALCSLLTGAGVVIRSSDCHTPHFCICCEASCKGPPQPQPLYLVWCIIMQVCAAA